jgi:hypothetical protein
MKYYLLILALFCAGSSVAQKQIYKIEWKGDSIGYLIANKSKSGELTKIELISETTFSILFSFDVVTDYLSVYRNNKLLSAISKSTLNDKERSLTQTKYIQDYYEVIVDGDKKRMEREISESIATMYYDPPNVNEIYSERHGVFCKVEKVSPTHYRLIKPDNRINNYHYLNGECHKVEVELAMAEIVLQRIL